MAKTRNRTKFSAVNNARTRAGKSKARTGGTEKVQESATVVRRKGKKKQVTRSPSPVAGPSGQPARSSSPGGSPPPATPRSEPSVQPVPNALSRNVVLKEGWNLLKSYFNNSASADDVEKFLQDAKEPELVEAFGEIMGCEPDDSGRQAELASKITLRIKELKKPAATVKQKQPGMFPSF